MYSKQFARSKQWNGTGRKVVCCHARERRSVPVALRRWLAAALVRPASAARRCEPPAPTSHLRSSFRLADYSFKIKLSYCKTFGKRSNKKIYTTLLCNRTEQKLYVIGKFSFNNGPLIVGLNKICCYFAKLAFPVSAMHKFMILSNAVQK